MFLTICVIVVLFLIAKATRDREWLPTICFFGIFVAGFVLMYFLNISGIPALLVPGGITVASMFVAYISGSTSSGSTSSSNSYNTPNNTPPKIHNPDLIIDGQFLRHYKGKSHTLVVPKGIFGIGCNDGCFLENIACLETIYIPRSVKLIKEYDLPFCESIYYEGSEAEWSQINIEQDNFKTGWKPDYYQDDPILRNYEVTSVSMHFNAQHPDWS